MSDPVTQKVRPEPRFALPKWLGWSVLAILFFGAWGVVSKVAVDYTSPMVNQVIFTIGLAPVVLAVALSKNFAAGRNRRKGAAFGFITGILGGTGNIMFFLALDEGGKASTVVPVTGLYPMVTVFAALILLREKLNRVQAVGIGLALAAIVLLNVA
jgi:transporter family protein